MKNWKYIKAKYKVVLNPGASGKWILIQTDNDHFCFKKEGSDFSDIEHFSFYPGKPINIWSSSVRNFILDALNMKLTPFYTAEPIEGQRPKVECNIEKSRNQGSIPVCTCPYENYSFAAGFIGCRCGASQKEKEMKKYPKMTMGIKK
jgi:hypothetical protein